MSTKEAAKKHASQFCISFPTSESDLKLNEEITRTISKHYIAGAAFERARILELLRSDEAAEDLTYGVFGNPGSARPSEVADYIEKTLKEGDA